MIYKHNQNLRPVPPLSSAVLQYLISVYSAPRKCASVGGPIAAVSACDGQRPAPSWPVRLRTSKHPDPGPQYVTTTSNEPLRKIFTHLRIFGEHCMFKLLAKSRQLAAELMDSLSSVCPGCNRQGKIVRRGKRGAGDNSRYTIRCSFRFCRKETALWAGTPLYRARVEPEELIVLLDLWLHKLNIRQLSYLMDMSRKAIRRILSKVADI
ncbi:hypothetical protein PAPHI01_2738, partial [Pancytospora philotis]